MNSAQSRATLSLQARGVIIAGFRLKYAIRFTPDDQELRATLRADVLRLAREFGQVRQHIALKQPESLRADNGGKERPLIELENAVWQQQKQISGMQMQLKAMFEMQREMLGLLQREGVISPNASPGRDGIASPIIPTRRNSIRPIQRDTNAVAQHSRSSFDD